MFRTHDSVLAGIPGMFGEGYKNWHMVERLLAMHWFHVSVEHREDGRTIPLVLMPSDLKMLTHILDQQDPTVVVTEIQVVSPAWMNKGEGWKMEKLVGLSIGYDQFGIGVSVIETAGGVVYTDAHQDAFDPSTLTNVSKVY
jgi:hypothetical protein